MSAHTPGPWRVVPLAGEYCGTQVVSVDGSDICNVWSHDDDDETPHDCANARLIAAAPKMLAALKHIHFYETVRDPNRGELFLGALRAIEAAIAEAEGAS